MGGGRGRTTWLSVEQVCQSKRQRANETSEGGRASVVGKQAGKDGQLSEEGAAGQQMSEATGRIHRPGWLLAGPKGGKGGEGGREGGGREGWAR